MIVGIKILHNFKIVDFVFLLEFAYMCHIFDFNLTPLRILTRKI